MKKIFTLVSVLSLLVVGNNNSFAQTTVPAVISSDQVWTASGSPYIINQNTFVDTGVSVKVMPGVEIKSTNSANKFIINGEFRAPGTKDSMILFKSVRMVFAVAAVDYDSAAGQGTYFNYCHISGVSSGRMIEVNSTSFRFENCLFTDFYNAIYNRGSSLRLHAEIFNCTFINQSTNGDHIYSPTFNSKVTIKGCYFKGGSSLYCYGYVTMENNNVNGLQNVTVRAYNGVNMYCNMFKNIKNGIRVNVGTQSSTISITHNTFDSINAPIMSLYTPYDEPITVNYNNFLASSSTQKVVITGTNPNPATFALLDFKNNYWETTDSTIIAGYIKDYTDDITIYGLVDFSNYLSSQDASCSTSPSSCNASFYVALDTSLSNRLFLINNSTGITSATKFNWTFGDGTSSSQKKPTHYYKKYGKYEICLTLSDYLNNCSSTYCDSLGLDSNGSLLKKEGFTIDVLDESDILNVPEQDQLIGMKLYPNPGNGNFILELPAVTSKEIQVRVMDLTGRIVDHKELTPLGNNEWTLNLANLNEGMYLLHMKTDQSEMTTKVIINR